MLKTVIPVHGPSNIYIHLAYSNLRYRSIIQPNGTGNGKRAEEEQSSMNAWAGSGL